MGGVGGLPGLLTTDRRTLHRHGAGDGRAAILLASVELLRRLTRHRVSVGDLLDRPGAVADYVSMNYAADDQEILGALYLDIRNRLIAERGIFRGTLTRAAVEPRPILREALQQHAASIILFHCHPSGDPTPSDEDRFFTRRVAEAGDLLGVRLLDHVVVGSGGRLVSLSHRGW
ncbi:MAG: DNA repair protein RadC [bacterium]|nr:DNA repair protein RadC [bacterium]